MSQLHRSTAALFAVITTVLGGAGCQGPGPILSEELVVPSSNWHAKVIPTSNTPGQNQTLEVRLELRHLSGPPVDVWVLDERQFNRWEEDGEWLMAAGGGESRLLGYRVMGDGFGPVHESLRILGFDNSIDIPWTRVPRADTMYLVLSNTSDERQAEVLAGFEVR